MKKQLLILLFLASGSLFTFAQDTFQKELFSADVALKYRSDIGLSSTQVDAIKDIHASHSEEFNSIKWDLDAELVALNKLLKSAKVDKSASMAQMEKVMTLEDQLKRIRLDMLISIKNELTETQQNKLKTLRTDSDMQGISLITPINENPRVLLKVDGTKKEGGQPLYIIKDKKGERRVTKIDNIDPDSIKSINVIKGEAAIKLYGKDGKNGVVEIHLKK